MGQNLLSAVGAGSEAVGETSPVSMPPSLIQKIEELENLVNGLFASWLGGGALVPSRRSHRIVSQQVFAVTPVDDRSLQRLEESCRVQAWDISAEGISFTHRSTLPFRTVAATFSLGDGELHTILTRLKWCRFTRQRYYRSGGQFLRTVRPDWEASLDLTQLADG